MSESEKFLGEVREGLSRRLPAEEIPERVMEIAAHLSDAAEAYGEFGDGEAEAVRAMGCPKRLAQSLARDALSVWDQWRLYLAALAFAGYGANMAGISLFNLPLLTKTVAVVSILATVAMTYCAFRARSSRLYAIFAMGTVLVGPMLLLRTTLWLNMPYPDGPGNLPRASISYRRDVMARDGNAEGLAYLNDAATESFLEQAARQIPVAVSGAATLVTLLGSVDAGFAGLGVVALTVRRSRRRTITRGGIPGH